MADQKKSFAIATSYIFSKLGTWILYAPFVRLRRLEEPGRLLTYRHQLLWNIGQDDQSLICAYALTSSNVTRHLALYRRNGQILPVK